MSCGALLLRRGRTPPTGPGEGEIVSKTDCPLGIGADEPTAAGARRSDSREAGAFDGIGGGFDATEVDAPGRASCFRAPTDAAASRVARSFSSYGRFVFSPRRQSRAAATSFKSFC